MTARDNAPALKAQTEQDTYYCVDSGDGTRTNPFWLTDISAGGARLMGRNVANMPDTFSLRVRGYEGGLWRCQVIWRSDTEIGVAIEQNDNEIADPR